MPAISVIIPAYNAAKTILETIQSIQAQTFSDFEIIIINDGSNDQTLEIIGTVKDSRIKVFSYENGGLPVARNRGITHATGEFISFIDADDLWTPDKLELQLAALQQHPEAGVAYSWTNFIDQKRNFLYSSKAIFFEGDVYSHLLLGNFISNGSNILVRRQFVEAVGDFDSSLKSSEDRDYYIRLAALCPFVVVPKYQILYRQSSQSMTAKVDIMEKASFTVIEKAFQTAPPELKPLKNKSLSNNYRYLAKLCIAHSLNQDCVRQSIVKLKKSIELYPKSLLEKETQRLVIKLIIIRLLLNKVSLPLFLLISKFFPRVSLEKNKLKSSNEV